MLGVGEAQICTQTATHIVTIEHTSVAPLGMQLPLTRPATVHFPAPDRPVNHTTHGR